MEDRPCFVADVEEENRVSACTDIEKKKKKRTYLLSHCCIQPGGSSRLSGFCGGSLLPYAGGADIVHFVSMLAFAVLICLMPCSCSFWCLY